MLSNGTYFAKIYQMAKKYDAGQALKTFVIKLGVPKELKIDGSEKQNIPGTDLMKSCKRNGISLTRTDPERPNQNPAEGVIREVRKQ